MPPGLVAVVVIVVKADERPVVEPVALGALAARHLLPGPRRDLADQGVSAVAGAAGVEVDTMVAGHRHHLPDRSGFQLGPQGRVGAVDLVAGHPAGRNPASNARRIIPVASAGLVANSTCSGMPASWRRSRSPVQLLGPSSSRSMMACPALAA